MRNSPTRTSAHHFLAATEAVMRRRAVTGNTYKQHDGVLEPSNTRTQLQRCASETSRTRQHTRSSLAHASLTFQPPLVRATLARHCSPPEEDPGTKQTAKEGKLFLHLTQKTPPCFSGDDVRWADRITRFNFITRRRILYNGLVLHIK